MFFTFDVQFFPIYYAQTILRIGKRVEERSQLDSSHLVDQKNAQYPARIDGWHLNKKQDSNPGTSGIQTRPARTECRRSTTCTTTTAQKTLIFTVDARFTQPS